MTTATDSQSQIINISPSEYTQLPQTPLLLDVRSSLEYKMFRAPQAINLSLPRILMGGKGWLAKLVLPSWFHQLSLDETLGVICLTAHRSPIAARQLRQYGFTKVYNVTGGMMEWRQLGLPTV